MNMHAGILIYTAGDAAHNKWFIQQLIKHAEPEGVTLRLCIAEQNCITLPDGFQPEFAVNRSRIAAISEYCEETLHIPVYNSRAVTEITNDKFRTYQHLHLMHGIPMAKTWRIAANDTLPALHPPLIAKPADGHGGAGVTLLQTDTDLHAYAETAPRPFLLQMPMILRWDVRIYVLNGSIYAAVLRTSASDFRSNFSLGGNAELIQPDADMCRIVEQVQAILPLDFAGVDLLRHPDGGYVLGEIEDAVGCRMLYQLTDKDPAKDYITYLCNKLK